MKIPAFTGLPRRMLQRYGTPKGWRGPVVRREPATYQPKARDCGLTKCTNEWCRLWILSGSARCPHCHVKQGGVGL